MKPPRSFAAVLHLAPTRTLRATLVRRVPLSPLIGAGSVDYLFMSGRPYRYNTEGVSCIYFSEDEPTAAAEYERHTRPLRQPFATYFADVDFAAVLDLCSPATVKALGLTTHDLQANWVRAKRPTSSQLALALPFSPSALPAPRTLHRAIPPLRARLRLAQPRAAPAIEHLHQAGAGERNGITDHQPNLF